MPYWIVVLVLLAGIATTVGLGGLTAGWPTIHVLIVIAFAAAFAMATLARPRPT